MEYLVSRLYGIHVPSIPAKCPKWARQREDPWRYDGWIKRVNGKLAVKPDPSNKPDGDYIEETDEYPEGAVCWVKKRWD